MVVTSILVLITAYILTTTVILPVATKNPLPEAVLPKAEVKGDNNAKKSGKADNTPKKNGKTDKGAKKADDKVQNSSAAEESISSSKDDLMKLFELKKTETLLRSRYSLSSEDSIYLVLDLINKVARLEMKGIPLHDSNINKVWISNSIKMFHTEALLHWIAQPFILKMPMPPSKEFNSLSRMLRKIPLKQTKPKLYLLQENGGCLYCIEF